MKILIVEDDKELAIGIAKYLSLSGYSCEFAYNFTEAESKIIDFSYTCVLLDLMIPGGDGIRILSLLREQNKSDGVIVISAKNELEDKVNGLYLGADDYLVKPFHLSELEARVYSLVRRKNFNSANVVDFNELRIDLIGKNVYIDERSISLTKKEFSLLVYFLANKNRILSKYVLAEHLSGDFSDMLSSHDFVYAHVKNLKKKLKESGCKEYIKNIYGSGYKWEE